MKDTIFCFATFLFTLAALGDGKFYTNCCEARPDENVVLKARVLANRASCYASAEKPAEALKDAKEAIALEPDLKELLSGVFSYAEKKD